MNTRATLLTKEDFSVTLSVIRFDDETLTVRADVYDEQVGRAHSHAEYEVTLPKDDQPIWDFDILTTELTAYMESFIDGRFHRMFAHIVFEEIENRKLAKALGAVA